MKKELLSKLRHKHGIYIRGKQGQATCDGYRGIVRECRKAMKKAKTHLELNLAKNIRDHKKGFFK